jgi:cyclophilin family peptidyl-prolyl cis-trans isomerase
MAAKAKEEKSKSTKSLKKKTTVLKEQESKVSKPKAEVKTKPEIKKSTKTSKKTIAKKPEVKGEVKEQKTGKVDVVSIPESKKVESEVSKKPLKTTKSKAYWLALGSIVLVLITLISAVLLTLQYGVRGKYKPSRVVNQIISINALKSDDQFGVAVMKKCDLAFKYDKNLYEPKVTQSEETNFGFYSESFKAIFGDKPLILREIQFASKDKTKASPVISCIDGDKKDDLKKDDLDKVSKALDDNAAGSFDKLDSNKDSTPLFNDFTKGELDFDLIRNIYIPANNINNSLFGIGNKLVFAALPKEVVGLEMQIDSLSPSKATYDVEKELSKTDDDENKLKQELEAETRVLNFDQYKKWNLTMTLADFGDLNIELNSDDAPKSVENFVRLVNRKYFDGTTFHRMVKQNSFEVIQGGDGENGDGSGGKSAFWTSNKNPGFVPDEMWITTPAYDQSGQITNSPVLKNEGLYRNFDPKNGLITYPKGSIAMAKTAQPNSATSQFFIILSDTVLPADYTIFGVIKQDSFDVLDKISSTVSPVTNSTTADANTGDGKPNKALNITQVLISSKS